MYDEIKALEFSGEMKTNDLYYLFKTNSSQINLEILSKLQKFPTLTGFFKHYMKKDIKVLNDTYDNFIHILSQFSSLISKAKFESNIDQYISDFSYIYTLFNILLKLNDSLNSIISNIKNNITTLYNKYHIDKNKQEKIDECVAYLLDISQHKNNSHNFFSKCSTKENSNGSIDHYLIINDNKEFYDSSKQQKKLIKDLLGRDKNINLNKITSTPKFNNIDNSTIPSNKNENCDNNIHKGEQNKEEFSSINKESTDSEFTLSSNEKKQTNKGKENISNNISKENVNKINELSDDINDYITNINPNDLIIKPHRRNSTIIRQFNSNLNINKNRYQSIDRTNVKSLYSSYKNNNSHENLLKNLTKSSFKKLHFSSGHLFMKEELKIYTELLELITELYNENKINSEQKLKLKKLIIIKSPKILSVYKLFNQNDEIFIQKLKELVQ